jgi:hypothetical protein
MRKHVPGSAENSSTLLAPVDGLHGN